MVFAKHYEDGFVSFDYPYDSNVTTKDNMSDLVSTDSEGTFAIISNGVDLDKGGYTILIYFSPINRTESVPINETVNQTVGFNSNGSTIVEPVNVTTPLNYKDETVNVLQRALDNFTASGGKLKTSTKNGLTHYDFGSGSSQGIYINTTDYATIIVKNGTSYFFIVYLNIYEPEGSKNDVEGYNAYQQILNSFKIGKE